MVEKNINKNSDYSSQSGNANIFDDDRLADDEIETVQDPYPVQDRSEDDEILNQEDDEDEENVSDVHEYEDTDHPHEYIPPVGNINSGGISGNRTNSPFENQNPLQSNFPSSERDRR